jgi:hypothetical protein
MKYILILSIVFFTACSDNGTPGKYNTPRAQVLTPQQYPLNKWRAEHERNEYGSRDPFQIYMSGHIRESRYTPYSCVKRQSLVWGGKGDLGDTGTDNGAMLQAVIDYIIEHPKSPRNVYFSNRGIAVSGVEALRDVQLYSFWK